MGTASISDTLFTNGGEMGALMHVHDWESTLLGAVAARLQSLKTIV